VNKGKKILDGSVNGVKQQFKENLFNIQLNQSVSASSSDIFDVISRRNNGLVVKIRNGYQANDVLKYFIDQHAGILSFNEILPSLNEIFIKLVEGTSLSRQFQKVTV